MADEERTNQEELTEEDQAIYKWAAFNIAFAIEAFGEEIRAEISRLRAAGIVDTEIGRILASDLESGGRIFGTFRNSVKRGVVSGIMQGSRLGQDRVYGNQLMQWISVGTPRICSDCESRVGELSTYQDWIAAGLPATGWSLCREFCYCQLVPEDVEIEPRVQIQRR